MANVLELFFKADTQDLDKAKEKLVDIGHEMPNVGEMIEGLIKSILKVPGSIGIAVAALGGLGLAVSEMVKHSIEAETALLELSEAVGIPVEKLQPFAEAMALAGISGDRLQASLSKLSVSVGQALEQPTGKAADAFKKLGISQKELADGDIEQILKDTAKGFDQYADSATKTAAIRALLGKQGPQMIAAMKDEAEFEVLAAEAQEAYGTKISATDAKSAKYFGETLKLGMSMFEGVGLSITKSLLPGLQVLVDQFAESGKQGGVMRDVLDALTWTITNVSKVIITLLVEPVRFVIEIFKEAGTAIGASMAAISAAIHGNFSQAKQVINDLGTDLKKMTADYEASSAKFVDALWNGTTAVKDQGKAVDDNKPKFEAYNQAAQKVTDTLDQLMSTLQAQLNVQAAAATSLQAYKQAQDEVAISTMRLKLLKDGANKTEIDQAESAMRAANASKQLTADEVAGWSLINRLTSENLGLLTHETDLQKNLAEIAKNGGMTDAQKQEATALAVKNNELKQSAQLEKELAAMDQLVKKDAADQIASMTLGANALKVYNEQAKLTAQYNKDIVGKTPAEVKQLTDALQKNKQAIADNNQQTVQWSQSIAGFSAGAQQAFSNLYTEATNLNAIGKTFTTTFVNGLTSALSNMSQGVGKSLKEMAASLVQFIDEAVIKFAILKIAVAAMEAYGISPSTINALLGAGTVKANANGNVFPSGVVPHANGGVVDSLTYFPMSGGGIGSMSEGNRPEAIMPLDRDSSGKLGVRTSGGGGSGGGGSSVTHNHSFVINSNQKPQDIAKQVRTQTRINRGFTLNTIHSQQRPGGILNNKHYAFAR